MKPLDRQRRKHVPKRRPEANKEPETEEVSGNTSQQVIYWWTSFTIDKGNDKGTSEYSVLDPLPMTARKQLYKTTAAWEGKILLFLHYWTSFTPNLLLNPDREPNERM